MLKVLTPAEMGLADRAAIGSGIPSLDLMRAAGHAVAGAAGEMMGAHYGRRVTALCGKGNNGGDGLVAAAFLAGRGACVRALLSDDPVHFQGDAGKAMKLFEDRCGPLALAPLTPAALGRELERSHLFIDALTGTGFRGALRGPAAEAAEALNRSGSKVLSVDVPSGVDGASGQVEGTAVRAERTVTLAALKPGLLLYPGAGYAGEVQIADIGISEHHLAAAMQLAEAHDVAARLPARPPDAHKRSVGKVLIVAGSRGMSGAAVLAARGALRAGAGLVWVAAPPQAAEIIEQSVTEAVVRVLPGTVSGSIAAGALERIQEWAEEADSVVIGPGMSSDEEAGELVLELFRTVHRPLIVDADGINAFAGRTDAMRSRTSPAVLTPHAGELARLVGEDLEQIRSRPVDSARKAARMTGAIVLLKGGPTLIAGDDRVVAVQAGGPYLASAGTGDVLSGVIAALAAGIPPFDAAWAGAWLHGRAGRLASEAVGLSRQGEPADRGILASDITRMLPAAISECQSGSPHG